ncbi:MAG: hypothetical protein WDW36_005272 [Sanguina aurantia]
MYVSDMIAGVWDPTNRNKTLTGLHLSTGFDHGFITADVVTEPDQTLTGMNPLVATANFTGFEFVVACNSSFGAAVPAGAPSTSLPAEVAVQHLRSDVLITGGVVDLSSLVGHFQYNVGGAGSAVQASVSTLFRPLSVDSPNLTMVITNLSFFVPIDPSDSARSTLIVIPWGGKDVSEYWTFNRELTLQMQANLVNDMQLLPMRVLTPPFPSKFFTLDARKRLVELADSGAVAAAAAAAGQKLAEAGSSMPPAAQQPGVTLLGSQLHDIQALTQQPQSSPAAVQSSQPSASASGAASSPVPPNSGVVGQQQHTSENSRLVAAILAGLAAVLLLM